jgi:hypothetical protein
MIEKESLTGSGGSIPAFFFHDARHVFSAF